MKLPSAARLLAAKEKMLEGQQSIQGKASANKPQGDANLSRMERGGGGGEAETRRPRGNSVIAFVPMILSFHQLTYEVCLAFQDRHQSNNLRPLLRSSVDSQVCLEQYRNAQRLTRGSGCIQSVKASFLAKMRRRPVTASPRTWWKLALFFSVLHH